MAALSPARPVSVLWPPEIDLKLYEIRSLTESLQRTVLDSGNVFEVLLDAVRCCSLGQITNALLEVGGQYRRSM